MFDHMGICQLKLTQQGYFYLVEAHAADRY